MIFSRLSHLQRFILPIQESKNYQLMLKNQVFRFGSHKSTDDNQRVFKKQPYLQKAIKPLDFSTPRENNFDKRLFKKSSSNTVLIPPKQAQPQIAKQTQQKKQVKAQLIKPIQFHPQQKFSSEPQCPQQQTYISTYKFHTCQILLNQFKDQNKQSKDIGQVIQFFENYKKKLKNNSVEDTQLKEKYKSIMFASVMRAFSRILRRQLSLQRAKIIRFIGDEFQAIANLDLSCLNTLELSDFIAFFFLFEMAFKYRAFSPGKIAVIDKYLKQIYNRYTQKGENEIQKGENEIQKGENEIQTRLTRSNYNQRQPQINDQKQDKRFVSELIIVAKTAQMFHAPMYDDLLHLLLQNVNQKKLVPYKITSFLKFLLRPENLTSVNKQLELFNMVLKKMNSTDIIKDFDYLTLKQLYSNLIAIVDNNHLLIDMSLGKAMITKIEQYVIELLPKMTTDHIYQFVLFSFKRDGASNQQLGKYVLQYVFSQIALNGQTSLNPLMIMYLVSTNVDQSVKFKQIDPEWQEKFINMYNLYLVKSQALQNLSYNQPQFTKLVTHIHSSKIKHTIIQSLTSPMHICIIPYNDESFIKQNYFLEQNDRSKIIASLHRLKQMQPHKDQFKDVFDELEQTHVTEKVKNQLYQREKNYIKCGRQVKINRQWYVKTLSRYCFKLGHEELVYSIFTQQLVFIVDRYADFKSIIFSQKSSNRPEKQLNFSRFRFPQMIDHKCREKVNALFLNFISITFELDLKLTNPQTDTNIQEKLQKNPFISLIRSQQLFLDIFLQVLTLRQTATVVHYHGKAQKIEFLLNLLKFLTRENRNKFNSKEESNHKGQENYYFVYFQILKNYPIQKLYKILSSPLCKQAVQKILYPKQQTLKTRIMNVKNFDPKAKATRTHFKYDKQTCQVFIDKEQAKILREKVKKGLELDATQSQKGKII